MERPWWKDNSPEYDRLIDKRRYVRTVYQSDPDVLRKPGDFLIRKEQGEGKKQFEDRCKLAAVVPLLPVVAEAFTGKAAESERTIQRSFVNGDGAGLGDPYDERTFAGQVFVNVDGRGQNYLPMLSEVSTELVLMNEVWGLVDGPVKTGANPTLRVIQTEAVPIFVEDENGKLISAVVTSTVNLRSDPKNSNQIEKRITVYYLDGFEVWRIVEGKEDNTEGIERVDQTVDGALSPYSKAAPKFRYQTSVEDEEPILPIFRVKMKANRYPAHTLATQNIAYFNSASELRAKHRTCNLLKLQMPFRDKDDIDTMTHEMDEGSNILWVASDSTREAKWVEPDGASLRETREWLESERRLFLFSALREYEASVQQGPRTATEVISNSSQGEHSYLNHLVAAMDDFETKGWLRLAQAEYPRQKTMWTHFSVFRKRDHRPLDEAGEADRLHRRVFGTEPVPLGATGRKDAARRIAELEGLTVDDNEITAEILEQDARRATENAFATEIGV